MHWTVYEKQLFEEIDLHFFIAGHSKHSNDRFFGLISNERKRRVAVESFVDVINIVKYASVCNKVVPVRNAQNESLVPYYDWKGFLENKYTNVPSYRKLFETSHFIRITK